MGDAEAVWVGLKMTTQAMQSLTTVDPFPPALADFVRRFVARSRQLRAIEAGGIALAFAFTWTLLWCLFDRLLPLPAWIRAALLVMELAVVIALLVRPIGRLLARDVPWHRAAAAIEASDPRFGGALQTALSQMLTPVEQRASPSMLAFVVEQTAAKAAAADPRLLLPSRAAVRPMLIDAAALLLIIALLASSWLNLPRLVERQLLPFAGAAPVTTTRLFVVPGSVNVIEDDALKVSVRAERLGDSLPVLQWRGDDPIFSSAMMQAEPGGGFSYTFGSIDRPFAYRVSGGDAASALFSVHVVARPAVHQLRVSYAYPDWTELGPKESVITSGNLEAPVGTTATISVIATEAISKAAAVLDNHQIESTPSVDPAVRMLTIPMQSSTPWHLDLSSAAGIAGHGPSGMSIRVIQPREPQANLRLPADQNDLRLHPRDLLTLGYEAKDQFALAKIAAQIAVNGLPPIDVAIPLGSNHQLQSGSFDIDLAQLAVNLGDVVTITLLTENRAGLRGTSNPCRIVVSPRSIDLNAQQRLSELREAARLAKLLHDEGNAASTALDQSPTGADREERDEQIAPNLAVADSITAELSRQLLRALTHSGSSALSNALAWMVDDTQRAASGYEAADATILTEMRDPLRDQLNRVNGVSDELQQSLDAFWRGELASELLAELQDAAADQVRVGSVTGVQAEAMRRSVAQAAADEKAGATQLGIDANAADIVAQLQQRIDQAAGAAGRYGQIDFASAANDWSSAQADSTAAVGFAARLTVGSQAEAVRPRGDFIWARDLELAARAARRIDAGQDVPAGARHDYPDALRSLQQVHVFLVARTPEAQLTQPIKAAEQARQRMRLWAGDTAASTQPAAAEIAQDPERTALEAAASEAEQKLEQDTRLEQAAPMQPNSASTLDLPPTPNQNSATSQSSLTSAELEKLQQTVTTERQLERLAAEQRMLRNETAKAQDPQLPDLAKQQAELTDAIQDARPQQPPEEQRQPREKNADQTKSNQPQGDQPQSNPPQPDQPRDQDDAPKDSRESAMNAIRSAQEQLMEMPKEIESSRQAEAHQHDAEQRADAAQQSAAAADAQTQAAQQILAQTARADADAAKTQAAAKRVSPDQSASLADSLREFAPEATPAVETIDQQLTPALTAMRQTQSAGDHDGNQRAAQQAEQAVAEAQRRLNTGLQSLLKRDPLTTAKFFSSKAAEALARPQPDRAAAMRLQRGAAVALEEAWDDALHRAAGQRLAHMPSLSTILRLYPTDRSSAGESALGPEPAPSEREWGRLREQRPDDLSAPSHEIDPPEYQDALRAYFRDLAREDAGTK
jgi:hypothetical protein